MPNLKLHRILLCFSLFLISLSQTMATHAAAGAITYEVDSISNGFVYFKFIRVSLSRTSSGINLPAFLDLRVEDGCGIGPSRSIILSQTSASGGIAIDSTFKNCGYETVSNSVQEINFYEAFSVSFPNVSGCSTVSLKYALNARSPIIQNLAGSGAASIALESVFDKSTFSSKQSTPIYKTNHIVSIGCSTGRFISNSPISDPDGDSLYIQIIPSQTSFNTTNITLSDIPFLPPYSISNPILSSSPFSFNNKNGVLITNNPLEQTIVLTYLVQEFRLDTITNSHSLIGYSILDHLIRISDSCGNVGEKPTIKASKNDNDFINGIIAKELNCNDSSTVIDLGFRARGNTITTSGSEFVIFNSKGYLLPIVKAEPLGSDSLNITQVRLKFGVPVDYNDTLLLRIRTGNDFNTISDICGATIPENDSLYLFVTTCSGVSLPESKLNSFTAYPNPAKELAQINVPAAGVLELRSINGTLLYSKNVQVGKHTLDLNNLQNGVYIVSLNSEKETFTKKIIRLN